MLSRLFPKVKLVRLVQFLNASSSIYVTPLPIDALTRLAQSEKAYYYMFYTLLGIVISVMPDMENAANPMLVTDSGIVTLVRDAQHNAASVIYVTLFPICICLAYWTFGI